VDEMGWGSWRRGLDFLGRRVRDRNDIPKVVETDVRRGASLVVVAVCEDVGTGETETAVDRSILTDVGTSWDVATGEVSRDRSANNGRGGEIISFLGASWRDVGVGGRFCFRGFCMGDVALDLT
jgi:hypothetical protein